MNEIQSYQDLKVWQRGMDLVKNIYQITVKLPSVEQWGLVLQMRRAGVSIPSNIAEGFGRQSTGEYRRFLSVARGSLLELETQVILCSKLNYLSEEMILPILDEIKQISAMLATLISRLR